MTSESSHRLPRICQGFNCAIFLGLSPIPTAHLPDGNSFLLDFKRLSTSSPQLGLHTLNKTWKPPAPCHPRTSPQPVCISYLQAAAALSICMGRSQHRALVPGRWLRCEGVQSHRAKAPLTMQSHCAAFYTCKIRGYSRKSWGWLWKSVPVRIAHSLWSPLAMQGWLSGGRGNEHISSPGLSIVTLGCTGDDAHFISYLQRNSEFEPLALCQCWGAAVCVHSSSAGEAEARGVMERTGQLVRDPG